MKKLLHISLLVIYLLGNTELRQLSSLPHLFSHFNKHQESDPSLSLLSFLTMHYGGDDGNSKDNTEDSTLPFKHPQTANIIYATVPEMDVQNILIGYSIPKLIFHLGIEPVSAVTLKSLFRPPISASC